MSSPASTSVGGTVAAVKRNPLESLKKKHGLGGAKTKPIPNTAADPPATAATATTAADGKTNNLLSAKASTQKKAVATSPSTAAGTAAGTTTVDGKDSDVTGEIVT